MPRTARAAVGGICYHVINRGNGRMKVFHSRIYGDILLLREKSDTRKK